MLSKLIVKSYGLLLEVALWLFLVTSFIGGWSSGGLGGALAALGVAFVLSVVFFGALLVLLDIRDSLRAIRARLDTKD
jgi:hypothetical protein